MSNANLVVLIESDADACRYFLSLPQHIRDRLNEHAGHIGTLAELRAQAQQMMWGG